MGNEYVFKEDGDTLMFLGDFDGLYSNEPNPWGQDGKDKRLKEYYKQSRNKLISVITSYKGSVSEIGCGLGYSLRKLHKRRKYTGYDISEIAIRKARKLFGGVKFKVSNIVSDKVNDDIIVINEMLWYVLENLDVALSNCQCKYLIVNQSFLNKQRYGKDIVNGFKGLISYLKRFGYKIVYKYYNSKGSPLKQGIVVCIRQNT